MSIRPQRSVQKITDLAAFLDQHIKVVSIEYGAAAEDGLGGVFYWDVSSTETIDNVDVVAHVSGNGRWLRVARSHFLQVRNNLDDVADANEAQNNLGITSAFGSREAASVWHFRGDAHINFQTPSALSWNDPVGDDAPFTMSAWIRGEDYSQVFPILCKDQTAPAFSAYPEYAFKVLATGKLELRLYDSNTGEECSAESTTSLIGREDEWIHVCVTFDGAGALWPQSAATAASGIKFYIDGLPDTAVPTNNALYTTMVPRSAPVWIGRSVASVYATGLVRSLQAIDASLSADEVLSMKNNTLGFITGYAGYTLVNGGSFLITNRYYEISNFVAGDDFTSSGAPSNSNGQVFRYNGTLPTWSNGSVLVTQGAVLDVDASDTAQDVLNRDNVNSRTFYGNKGSLELVLVVGWNAGKHYYAYGGAVTDPVLGVNEDFLVTSGGHVYSQRLIVPDSQLTPTIVGGTATITGGNQRVTVGADGYNIDTLDGPDSGTILFLRSADSNGITWKHGTGNIYLQGNQDYVMPGPEGWIMFLYDALQGKYFEISRRSEEIAAGIES